MVAKKLSINSILTSIYKIYLVMSAPPQFPDDLPACFLDTDTPVATFPYLKMCSLSPAHTLGCTINRSMTLHLFSKSFTSLKFNHAQAIN